MSERFKQQMDFCLKIDEEKNIFRQTHLSNNGRRENDAEHAWHMAIMAYVLKEYSNAEIDIAKVMLMCLIHDVVEIEAGDTYAYDEEGKKSQAEREALAAEHIFGILPKEQAEELKSFFFEFDNGDSPESKFARAMDNLQPLMLNDSNDGGDWREHDVRRDQVENRQFRSKEGSEYIFEYIKSVIEKHVQSGNIKE